MKKLLFTVAALMIFSATWAQTEISFGPKVGINLSNVTKIDMKYKPSVVFGMWSEFRFANWFALQPEVLYSKQGASDKIGDTKIKLRLNYINVPVLAKFFIFDGMSIDIGPQLGLNVASKMKFDESEDARGIAFLSDKFYNVAEFDVVGGLSYELNAGPVISLRYTMGITDVFKKDVSTPSFATGNEKTRTSVFQLTCGWKF